MKYSTLNPQAWSAILFAVHLLSGIGLHAENSFKVDLSDNVEMEFAWIPELNLWVGRYPVTLEQFERLSKTAARHPERYAARYSESVDLKQAPAIMLSWDEAWRACQTLNRRHGAVLPGGFVFRLPTEKEWEALARAGDDRKYPWGGTWPPTAMADGILPNLQGIEMIPAWREYHSDRKIEGYEDGWPSLAPVQKSGANEWGIFGLAGNVTEWCEGWYDEKRKLRLRKGSSAFTFNSRGSEITHRSAKKGQSPTTGLFFWGEVRNQGDIATGFRVVIGEPIH